MKKLLKKIYNALGFYYFFKKLGIININVIKIDGGLGSQIISYMQYFYRIQKDSKVKVDISFFNIPVNNELFIKDATYRKWKLDYYGIDFKSHFNKNIHNHQYSIFNLNIDDQMFNMRVFLSSDFRSIDWETIFPINLGTLDQLLQIINFNQFEYGVIHIRRGDFLKYSTYVVEDDKVINILIQVKNLLPENIFILSDDDFDSLFINKINKIFDKKKVKFFSGGDEILMHALMRKAKFLITSNSMFSLSAALLQRNDGFAIMPNKFYGLSDNKYNKFLNSISSWTILNNI